MTRMIAATLAPLVLLACAPTQEDGDYVSRAPAASAVGEAQHCLNTSLITRSVVQDDRTIDFRVGKRVYRNTLPHTCPRLGYERAITYEVRGGSLCAGETVSVLDTAGGLNRGPTCALGEFVPVEYVDRDKDMMGR